MHGLGPAFPESALALCLLISASLPGCGEQADAPSGPTVRDSAGIAIVEHPADAWERASRWELSREPILDLGGMGGPEAGRFHRVSDATRLPDGRIAVANSGSSEIRVFGPDGEHLLSFGGPGEGPGEFSGWMALEHTAGDSLLVWDTGTRRLSTFTADGALLGTVRPGLRNMGAEIHGILEDGTALFTVERVGEEMEQVWIRLVRVDPEGQVVDSSRWIRDVTLEPEGERRRVSPLYSPRMVVDVTPAGYWLGPARDYELRFHSAAGRLERLVRWEGSDLSATDDLREAYVRSRTEGKEGEARRRALEEAREKALAEELAAYTGLVVDGGGNLWVRALRLPGTEGPRRWIVFDGDGRLAATARTPRRLSIHEIGRDYVLGRWRDEMDVAHVRLYELRKPR